ncbi:MAG: hypothetical protein AMJ60_06255 [Desulfobacterales bacterium SG8_35]|nr:MAG: hypothetical protein AMJ60_06255 [Desulfobacterales bacterium SG8_35]
MTDETGETIKIQEDSSKKAKLESLDGMDGKKSERKSNNIREVSYMAVFTAVLGFGLLGYSLYLDSRDHS